MAALADITRRFVLKGALSGAALPLAAAVEPVNPSIDEIDASMTNDELAYWHLKQCAEALKAAHGGEWSFGLSLEHKAGYIVAAGEPT